MRGSLALILLVLVIGLCVAACGGDEEAAEDTTTEETTTETTGDDAFAAGRTVFVDSCGQCHALSEAGTSGSVGPSLDGVGLSADEIEEQVRNGGGGMPAFEGDLTDDEIENVSSYVAEAAGG
jgi:cytochrome c551